MHVRVRERTGKNVGMYTLGTVDARVVVIVCAWEEDGLVGRARLRAANADLRAGWIELGSAERYG